MTNVCISLFLHREQTHRSVKLHATAALAMRLWLWLSTAIKTKEWVTCHRKQHAFAVREGDPRSPLILGLHNVVLKGYFYYRKAVREPGVLEKYGRGTPNDWVERQLVGRFQLLGVSTMLTLDVYLFGFISGALVWAGQMLWVPLWAAGIVNGVGLPQLSTSRAKAATSFPGRSGLAAKNCTITTTPTRLQQSSRRGGSSSTWAGPMRGSCPSWA